MVRKLSASLPTLPSDLIAEILCRLPVKFLLQLRRVCKSWKSLISDHKFAKKHLTLSTTHTLHCISNPDNVQLLLKSYSLDSVLTNITQTQFPSPDSYALFAGSCNGILCLYNDSINDSEDDSEDLLLFQLWNPSIRKFKELPPLISKSPKFPSMYGFGYDSISDHYKVVVVFGDVTHDDLTHDELMMNELNREVKVHTLGTNLWKNVSKFPFAFISYRKFGQHVTGTINWLIFAGIKRVIASFDLGKECYREVLLPDDSSKVDNHDLFLSVFRNCLCMISGEDVWVMKEYGNKESWTKLFTISSMRAPRSLSYPYIMPIRVFEDEQVLMMIYTQDKRWGYICQKDEDVGYIFNNYKNDTSKFIELENFPEVCVESLISPYF